MKIQRCLIDKIKNAELRMMNYASERKTRRMNHKKLSFYENFSVSSVAYVRNSASLLSKIMHFAFLIVN